MINGQKSRRCCVKKSRGVGVRYRWICATSSMPSGILNRTDCQWRMIPSDFPQIQFPNRLSMEEQNVLLYCGTLRSYSYYRNHANLESTIFCTFERCTYLYTVASNNLIALCLIRNIYSARLEIGHS